jgi:hypothetical protein
LLIQVEYLTVVLLDVDGLFVLSDWRGLGPQPLAELFYCAFCHFVFWVAYGLANSFTTSLVVLLTLM